MTSSTDRSLPLILLLLPVALGLALFGCSGSRTTTAPGTLPPAFPDHSADEIRRSIQGPTDSLQRFAADARISVRTPQRNRSFNAEVRQQRADSLFMRFSLFGMEGGRLLLTADSVFFYDSRKRQLRVGPIADARQLLPAPVTADDVFANMIGLIAPDREKEWTVTADSSLYYLTDPSGRHNWTVDPSRWRVVRYTRKGADGTVVEKRHFSNFQMANGVVLPHQVIFRRPPDNLMARIEYEEIRLNPSGLSFDLDVPSNLRRTSLQGR